MQQGFNFFNLKGGKMIGEGGFGCVFYPSITCKGKEGKGKKYITKLQIHKEAAANEIRIGKRLKQILHYPDYFAPVLSYCPIKQNKLEDGIVKECNALNIDGDKTIISTKMSNIKGTTLFEYFKNTTKIGLKKTMHEIIYTFNYLVETFNILIRHGIVHFDVKSQNIMFDTEKNIPILIDFGLSMYKKDMKNEKLMRNQFYGYYPQYYYWCPEIHILAFIYNKNIDLSTSIIKQICTDIVTKNRILNNSLSDKEINKYMKELINNYIDIFTNKFNNDTEKFKQYLLSTYKTWDFYTVGLIYLDTIKLFNTNKNSKGKIHLLNLFKELLLKIIRPNPEKRINLIKFEDYIVEQMNEYKTDYESDDDDKDTNIVDKYINGFVGFLDNIKETPIEIQHKIGENIFNSEKLSKIVERKY